MKTLFIAELLGNPNFWKNVVAQEAQSADRIVQLGNLIGLKPLPGGNQPEPNLQLLRLANAYRYTQDDWLQIAGPNEMLALNYPGKFTSERSDEILRGFWFSGDAEHSTMLPAGVDKSRLVSHGGLTHGLWVELGKPQTAVEAAEAIEERYRGTIFQGDGFKLGHRPNFAANPIWADPLRETYPSWITAEERCPFGQIHSASNLNSEAGRLLRGEESGYFKWIDKSLYKSYGSITEIASTQFIGLKINLPVDKDVSKMPDGWSLYLEDTPSAPIATS